MTADRDFDRQLGAWFDERATSRAPEGLLERSLERVEATRQQVGWRITDRWRPRRAIGRPATARASLGRMLAVVAVVAIAAGAGLFLRLSPAAVGGPSSAPSIAASPSPSVVPSPSVAPSGTPAVVRPTGGIFAFIQASGYVGQLWVANLDGTGPRQLAPDLAGSKGTPSWSPDGTRLVFTLTPLGMGYPNAENGGSRLYMTDASGSVPQLVDTGCVAPCSGDNDAAFSRDGARLVFVRTLVHPQSGSPDPVTGKGPGSIVESVLATIDLSTGRVAELASTTIQFGGSRLENHNPRWSPDGTQIVFTQDVPYDINGPEVIPPPALFVVDADGRNLRQISSSGSLGDWSPDGARIVFGSVSHRAGPGNGYLMSQYFDIYTIRPDGTEMRRLTSDQISQAPSWTAGGRIGFFRDPTLVNGVVANTEPRQLWIMDADGGNATQLSVSPQLQQAWPIAWPPQA
jgi:Tol biopolymer transport system component